MRKVKDPPSKLTWQNVVMIELEWGFAFLDVNNMIFDKPANMIWAHFTHGNPAREVAHLLDLIKVDDKSAVWCSDDAVWSSDGPAKPGKSFAYWAKEFSSEAERFIVGDKKLCRLIKSNLVNRDFVACAGSLQGVEELKASRCTEMRKACDKLVPGISGMIKDNSRYVEVMTKILIPSLVERDPYKWSTTAGEPWFTPDEMQKILAKDAAAGDARKKFEDDYELAAMIKVTLFEYKAYSKAEDGCVQKLRYYEAKAKRGQKRSHTEMAEQEVGGT